MPLKPAPGVRTPIRLRVRFSKAGSLRYLSHRELITHITRAIRRAGVSVEYTQGFNPSPKIAFGPPLGVGVSGMREYFDMEMLPGVALRTVKEKINAALTGDVLLDEIASIGFKEPSLQGFVSRYTYEVLCADPGVVEEFLARDEVQAAGPDRVRLVLRDVGEKKVRLDEIMLAVFGKPASEFDITRTAVHGYRGRWAEPLQEGKAWQAAS